MTPATPPPAEHQDRLEQIGLLLAGALAPAERSETERHLRTCGLCRDELVDVAALPGLLGRLRSTQEPAAGDLEPQPGTRARLLAAAAAEARQRRRRQGWLVAAAVLPGLLALGAVVAPDRDRPAPAAAPATATTAPAPALQAMQQPDPALAVTGALATQQRAWGTALTLQMTWATGGRAVLVAVGRDGSTEQAASMRIRAGASGKCEGATSLQPDAVARFEVRDETGATLLVLPT